MQFCNEKVTFFNSLKSVKGYTQISSNCLLERDALPKPEKLLIERNIFY